MEFFSIDWVFGALTLACVYFLLQILLEYNKQKAQIRPQLTQLAEIRSRHAEEFEKVEASTEEATAEQEELDSQVAKLEAQQSELEEALKFLGKGKKG